MSRVNGVTAHAKDKSLTRPPRVSNTPALASFLVLSALCSRTRSSATRSEARTLALTCRLNRGAGILAVEFDSDRHQASFFSAGCRPTRDR